MTQDQLHEKLIHELHRFKIRAGEICRKAFASWHFTPSQWFLLRLVEKKPGVSPKEVAEALGISKGAVTQQVNELIRLGYLHKRRSRTDRRRLGLELTEQAKQEIAQARRQIQLDLSKQFAVLSREELAQLYKLLRKINEGNG